MLGPPPPPALLPTPVACQLFRAQTDNPKILKAVPQQLGVADTLPTAAGCRSLLTNFGLIFLTPAPSSASSDTKKTNVQRRVEEKKNFAPT